jgi:hypothetical protein
MPVEVAATQLRPVRRGTDHPDGVMRGRTAARTVAAMTDRDHTPPVSGWAESGLTRPGAIRT